MSRRVSQKHMCQCQTKYTEYHIMMMRTLCLFLDLPMRCHVCQVV